MEQVSIASHPRCKSTNISFSVQKLLSFCCGHFLLRLIGEYRVLDNLTRMLISASCMHILGKPLLDPIIKKRRKKLSMK